MQKITLSIVLEKTQAGQYYLKGTRLAFDLPYSIYVVNGDRFMPYYRVHIGGALAGIFNYEREAEKYLLQLTSAQAHVFDIKCGEIDTKSREKDDHCTMHDIVNDVLSKHKEKNKPLDVHQICRSYGIVRIPYSSPKARHMAELVGCGTWIDKTPGFLVQIVGTSAIFYDDSRPIEYQRATLAHELGHYLLGHLFAGPYECDCGGCIECQANAFAFLLLHGSEDDREIYSPLGTASAGKVKKRKERGKRANEAAKKEEQR